MAQFSRYYTYVAPLLQTEKNQAYTMLVLSFFAIAFFGFFAIRPTILTIVSLQREISDAEKTDQALAQKMKQLAQAQDTLLRLSPKKAVIDQALPPNPNVSSIVRLLEAQAQKAGVTMGSMQFRSIVLNGEEAVSATNSSQVQAATTEVTTEGTPNAQKTAVQESVTVTPIKVTFNTNGTEAQVSNLLHQLTTTRRLITVDSVHIIAKTKDIAPTTEISLTTYQMNQQ